MPVGVYPGANSAIGNGVTTVFAYSYRILAQADLKVVVDGVEQTLGTHYTVDGVGAANGGNVTFLAAPANGAAITIERDRAYVRTIDYQRSGSFDEETVDADFDSVVMLVQQVEAASRRAIKAPVSVTADQVFSEEDWAARAGKFVRAKNDGSGIEFIAASPDDDTFTASYPDAVARSWSSKVGEVISVKDFGAQGDGVADDSGAIQAALTAAGNVAIGGAAGATVYAPAGDYKCLSALTKPAKVRFLGAGMDATVLRFDGVINGIREVDAGPTFADSGVIEEMRILGQNGALKGVHVEFRQVPLVHRCRVAGFSEQAIFFNHTIMGSIAQSIISGSGSANHGQVEVDNSTTFKWDHSYISGSNIAGTTVAGLRIDRTVGYKLIGGASESTGIPLQLCGKAENTTGVKCGVVIGTDFENPNNGAVTYIEAGAGWTGAAGAAVQQASFLGVNGSVSASATLANAVRLTNTDTIRFAECSLSIPASGAGGVSVFELVGANNVRTSLGVMGTLLGAGLAYVRVNGATRDDATPQTPWELLGREIIVRKGSAFALNSTTPSAAGTSFCSTNSAIATAITNITGGVGGQVLYIYAGDINTTLNHNAGGAGKIMMRGSANLLLAVGRVYEFIYDSIGAAWVQIM